MRSLPTRLLAALAAGSLLLACGDGVDDDSGVFVPIQGAALDGSEDALAAAVAETPGSGSSDPAVVLESAGSQFRNDPAAAEAVETSDPEAIDVPDDEPDDETLAADLEPAGEQPNDVLDEEPAAPEPAAPEPAAPEPDAEPSASDGPAEISFWDLSLNELDVDAMLDAHLNPDEYTPEELVDLAFPEEVEAVVDREVIIKGYMIPGKMVRGDVRDFMLVRDLLGCCFGGAPLPDEWVDVTMEPDAEAEYFQYIPVRVTGTFSVGGEQDKAGFARGVYRMAATTVAEPD